MPKCPHPGCNKSTIFKRNLICANCDSSRHAPHVGATFGNQLSSKSTKQVHQNTINNLVNLSALQSDEVHTSSPPVQHFHTCSSSDRSNTDYSSGGCSSDGYSGGGGDFSGGGSGSDY